MAKAVSKSEAEIQELEPLQKRELPGLMVADLEESKSAGLDDIWLKEAQRRFQELKDVSVKGVPASQVLAKLGLRLG